MKGIRNIAKNTLIVYVARGFDILSSVIIIAILTRYLGIKLYGQYAVVMATVFTVTAFANMGMPKILIRELSQDKRKAADFLGASLIFSIIMFAAVILISTVVVFTLRLEIILAFALGVAIVAEMVRIFSSSFIFLFVAFEKMGYDVLVTVSSRLVFFALIFVVVTLQLNYIYIFSSMILSNSIGFFLALSICAKKFNIKPKFGKWKGNLKYLSMEILPVGVSFIILQLLQYVDIFILKILKSFEEVALFQAPYMMILKLQFLPRILVIALAPLLARLAVADTSYSKLNYIYSMILKYLAAVSFPLTLLIILFSGKIVPIIFGDTFLGSVVPFKILICALPIIFMDLFSDAVLVTIGRQRLPLVSAGVALIINFILDIMLINKYSYIGASIASLTSLYVMFGLNFYFVSRSIKNISLSMFVVILALSGFMMGIVLLGPSTYNTISIIGFIIIYVAMLLISGMFSRKEFSRINNLINYAGEVSVRSEGKSSI